MTNQEFEKILIEKKYEHYSMDGRKVVIHRGHVDINDIKTLPEKVTFNNNGHLCLASLVKLPKDVEFYSTGWIHLGSIKQLTEGVVFKNFNHIDCPKLEGKHAYLGQELEFEWVQDKTMIIESRKTWDGYEVYEARFFQGKPIEHMTKRYVAKYQGLYDYGDTMKEAVENVTFKYYDRKSVLESRALN